MVQRKCNIKKLKSIYSKNTGTNNCGNIRMKVAVGEIMLGFRLEDQDIIRQRSQGYVRCAGIYQ